MVKLISLYVLSLEVSVSKNLLTLNEDLLYFCKEKHTVLSYLRYYSHVISMIKKKKKRSTLKSEFK